MSDSDEHHPYEEIEQQYADVEAEEVRSPCTSVPLAVLPRTNTKSTSVWSCQELTQSAHLSHKEQEDASSESSSDSMSASDDEKDLTSDDSDFAEEDAGLPLSKVCLHSFG